MAYAFRQATTQGNSSGGALTVSKPTGTVDGDLIVVMAYLETDTNTWDSVGSGFNAGTVIANAGLFKLWSWWKWASGEPASWTWTPHTSAWRVVAVASYSGGGGSGSAPDVADVNQGDAQVISNQTAPSVTTTVANDLLVFGYGNFSGTNVPTTTGAATNVRASLGGCTIADANIATPSATGTSRPSGGVGTEDFAAMHVAYFLSPVTLTLEQEGFRFRNDDGSEASATWQQAQDTNDSIARATLLRLRMLINATADPPSEAYQIEYRKAGSLDWRKLQ